MMKRREGLFLLTALVWCGLCGGAFAQTGGGVTPSPRQDARAVENVAAPQGWKRYEIQYGQGSALRVVLPAPPEETSGQIPMDNLPPATQHLFTSSNERGVYVVGYLEGIPAGWAEDPQARKNFFTGLWEGFAQGISSELKKNGIASEVKSQPLREIRVSGHRTQVQDFTVGQLAGNARAVLAGGFSYLVVNISYAEKVNEEGASFLDSFELRPKR